MASDRDFRPWRNVARRAFSSRMRTGSRKDEVWQFAPERLKRLGLLTFRNRADRRRTFADDCPRKPSAQLVRAGTERATSWQVTKPKRNHCAPLRSRYVL